MAQEEELTELEKRFKNISINTACLISTILVEKKPAKLSDVDLPQKNVSAEVAYNRIINERPDIELLTKPEEYKNVTQKLRYRCKNCGEIFEHRKDKLITKQAGVGKPFPCKGCGEKAYRHVSQELVLQKTFYYVNGRGGKIVRMFEPEDERPYINESDKIQIRCKEGHEWITTHRYLHTGAWCTRCRAIRGNADTLPPFPTISDYITPETKYYAYKSFARRSLMEILFPVLNEPEETYFCQCIVCKQTNIISLPQMLTRNYLCLNRCAPAEMPSPKNAVICMNTFAGNIEENMKEVKDQYARDKQIFYRWLDDPSIYPKPLKRKGAKRVKNA